MLSKASAIAARPRSLTLFLPTGFPIRGHEMPSRIEDYALIGDCHTAALVARDGSIDWLCLPRFDAGACFAALLGKPEHGRWMLAPAGRGPCTHRQYRPGTLILETDYETETGAVTIVDCMPMGCRSDVVRLVVG